MRTSVFDRFQPLHPPETPMPRYLAAETVLGSEAIAWQRPFEPSRASRDGARSDPGADCLLSRIRLRTDSRRDLGRLPAPDDRRTPQWMVGPAEAAAASW